MSKLFDKIYSMLKVACLYGLVLLVWWTTWTWQEDYFCRWVYTIGYSGCGWWAFPWT
jgi:hypothetical protein